MKKLLALGAGVFLALSAFVAPAAIGVSLTTYSGANAACNEPNQIQACANDLIVNKINPGIQLPAGSPRNFLDNGAFAVQQYGTGIITCAINGAATTVSTYVDRWACDTNVAVGAGRQQIVTTGPTPPTGFAASLKVYRNSGALTQPVCTLQEIATLEATYLAGQQVTFSFYGQALAGLAADNGGVVNAYVLYGTGSDQGLGTWTASPAITPAWTGINSSLTQAFTLTTAWSRNQFTANVPATATEIAVAICFTPTATGAGVTDGFAFTGAQLEIASSATAYEFRKYGDELARAQRYYWTVAEGAATTTRAMCMASSTTLAICNWTFPVTMRVAPSMSYTNGFATATTTAGSTLGACTTLRTSTLIGTNASNASSVLVDCVAGTVPAAGSADYLADNGGSGVIKAFADF